MAELGKKLGKLSLAILENFVEGTLGEKFVDELRAPTNRALAVDAALEKSEERLKKELGDKVFAEKIFTQISDRYIGLLVDVVGKFYDHPTEPDFQKALVRIVTESFPHVGEDRISSAIERYITILTEELALVDETFRENVRALADLRGEKSQQEMVDILRRVEVLLSQQKPSKVENAVFRSLHQLPQPPADFTGREKIIQDLLADFDSHKGATISGLTGMGGIGKTALGLEVAHKIAEKYPDAQIFLDLKGTTTPLSAVDIARHVILTFEPTADLRALDETNMGAAYQSVLHDKKALLFLDNARSADQVAPLIPPGTCAMLVTSRWNFPVAGLKAHKVGVLQEDEAVAFLLELCPRIGEKAPEIAKTCGFLPLALRIAGSFLQVNGDWNVEKYLIQLSDRKKRLETLARSREGAELPAAEPDLLATFELSYNALSEEDRKRWRALGVFPASFAASAAQAIWELDEDETAKLLGSLRRYSLLEFDENSSRYGMHDLLADYALSQMNASDEKTAQTGHAQHYLNILQTANQLYLEGKENVLFGLQLLDNEWQHIVFAQSWIGENANEKDLLELCNEYPNAGYAILSLRLHPRAYIDWLETGLKAARSLQNKKYEGYHLGNLGLAYAALGDARKAIEFYEGQLVIVREIGDRRGEGAALGNLGNELYKAGEKEKGISMVKRALEIFEAIESPNAQWARNKLNEWGVEE